jgi:hypothetical protein
MRYVAAPLVVLLPVMALAYFVQWRWPGGGPLGVIAAGKCIAVVLLWAITVWTGWRVGQTCNLPWQVENLSRGTEA